MEIVKRSRWIIGIAILIALPLLFLTRVSAVRAAFSDMHMFDVLLRVESELMQKTPAGQYYESLFWKHTAEICRIMSAYPENNENILHALRLYTPALESLVDGKGDTVRITSEQVDVLKAQLDFYAAVGSPALREDVEKERRRLQLDRFVGVTMSEAWDIINSAWTPETVEPPMLVPGADGKWAYYVHHGVYLEYPANYSVQKSGMETNTVYFVPSFDIPESWNPCVVRVRVRNVPVSEKDANNPHSRSRDTIVWEDTVRNIEFPGMKFISSEPGFPVMNFLAHLYNEEKQIAVDIWVFVNENPQFTDPSEYSDLIAQRYEYFLHMVDSLRIQ